jgi:hypothetical protein
MTQEELNLWVAYVQENGPLNLALRIESAVARAVAPFLKNVKPRDLMVWPIEQEKEPTLEEMKVGLFCLFKGLESNLPGGRNG